MSVARPPRKKVTVMERVLAWEQAYHAVLAVLGDSGWSKAVAARIAADLIRGTEEAG